jgi:hypothetical protein
MSRVRSARTRMASEGSQSPPVSAMHVAEAVQYRSLDRNTGRRPAKDDSGGEVTSHLSRDSPKFARTIADLGNFAAVSARHVAGAVQYRSLDRNY